MNTTTFTTPRGASVVVGPNYKLPKDKDGMMSFWVVAHHHPRRVARALGWSGPGSVKDVDLVAAIASNVAAHKIAKDKQGRAIYAKIARDLLSEANHRVLHICRSVVP